MKLSEQIEMDAMRVEFLRLRATVPRLEAAMLKAREALTHVAFRGPPQLWSRDWSFNPSCPSCHAADGGSKKFIHSHGCKLEAAILGIDVALDAAAKPGDGLQTDSFCTADPQPSSSEAGTVTAEMTPEQRARNLAIFRTRDGYDASHDEFAFLIAEQIRAAVAAAEARKDAEAKNLKRNLDEAEAQLGAAQAEVARWKGFYETQLAWRKDAEQRLAAETGSKAALPERRGEGEAADLRWKLENELLGLAQSGGLADSGCVMDALDAYLDARSKA